jgi:hypothetical protein
MRAVVTIIDAAPFSENGPQAVQRRRPAVAVVVQ